MTIMHEQDLPHPSPKIPQTRPSPGGPYGIVSADNFGRPGITDYRNPTLADLLRGLGYVQRFGMGLPSSHRSLKANGNPPPEFTVTDSYVSVIIRRRP